jgi:hypothetical protein
LPRRLEMCKTSPPWHVRRRPGWQQRTPVVSVMMESSGE